MLVIVYVAPSVGARDHTSGGQNKTSCGLNGAEGQAGDCRTSLGTTLPAFPGVGPFTCWCPWTPLPSLSLSLHTCKLGTARAVMATPQERTWSPKAASGSSCGFKMSLKPSVLFSNSGSLPPASWTLKSVSQVFLGQRKSQKPPISDTSVTDG